MICTVRGAQGLFGPEMILGPENGVTTEGAMSPLTQNLPI